MFFVPGEQCDLRRWHRRLGRTRNASYDSGSSSGNLQPFPLLFRGKAIRSWGGPGKGTLEMDGSQWLPYQAVTFPTPPFPDYVSGHSTYSAAAARILELWTGSDHFGNAVTLPAGSSKIEPGVTPAHPVTLRWQNDSPRPQRMKPGCLLASGALWWCIHSPCRHDLLAGRLLGRIVAFKAWQRAQGYFDGTAEQVLRVSAVEPAAIGQGR